MNTYVILACSDPAFQIYDIFIDTVEAWTAPDAMRLWAERTFAFKQMYQLHGSWLCKCLGGLTEFRAYPLMIDKDNPKQYLYLPYKPPQKIKLF